MNDNAYLPEEIEEFQRALDALSPRMRARAEWVARLVVLAADSPRPRRRSRVVPLAREESEVQGDTDKAARAEARRLLDKLTRPQGGAA